MQCDMSVDTGHLSEWWTLFCLACRAQHEDSESYSQKGVLELGLDQAAHIY
jgi:hypothetical protein